MDDEIARSVGWWLGYGIFAAMTAMMIFRVIRKRGMSPNWGLLSLIPIWGAVIVYAVSLFRGRGRAVGGPAR
jgi:hypothetical protein